MKDMAGFIPAERIWNPRWLNATYKLQDIWTEIDELAYKVHEDIDGLRRMDMKHESAAIAEYCRTLDFRRAVEKDAQLTEQEKRMEQIVPVQEDKNRYATPYDAHIAPSADPDRPELIKPIDVRIYVTEKQKAALKQFLKDNNIRYTSVPK